MREIDHFMESREKNINYENEYPKSTHGIYDSKPIIDGNQPYIHPYYFFGPSFLENRIPIHQEKYRYIAEQENQFCHPMDIFESSIRQSDQERIKSIWKKERNRIAAKRWRDKRIAHLRELERKEGIMICEISELKEAIYDYDNILENILQYIQECLNMEERHENLVFLLNRLCNLKKFSTPKPVYLRDISHLFPKNLSVTNERIDKVTEAIRCSLSKLLGKD
ncbi:leucine zipper domain-containing protein [Encephalitozoon intestinalis ATCC 50506]|uniref:Leucine zipper domain-containing protein n=1 Tax=Encephalitozoon intestinalis (strain ATCC 50506) TaxID=876142 RepID=E0S6F4_ENCIT|nr:leucine zipper domain-containing protein [Encephalitozoon intestinalis ATCC 50506]ADM11289.1 leucine zipper domain-containing protein [Encephalitozoon intestinalis ATCC 50506]UTX44958.1 leucine zipper domain-containing protein [Encephalitozoon intestinalis]